MFSTAMRRQRLETVTGGVQQRSADSEIPFVTNKLRLLPLALLLPIVSSPLWRPLLPLLTLLTPSQLLGLLLTLLLIIYPADYVGNRRADIFAAVKEFVAWNFGLWCVIDWQVRDKVSEKCVAGIFHSENGEGIFLQNVSNNPAELHGIIAQKTKTSVFLV